MENLPISKEHISKSTSEDLKRLNFEVREKCLIVERPNQKLASSLHATFDKTILQDITFIGQLGKSPDAESSVRPYFLNIV
jgi:hypothetical protein